MHDWYIYIHIPVIKFIRFKLISLNFSKLNYTTLSVFVNVVNFINHIKDRLSSISQSMSNSFTIIFFLYFTQIYFVYYSQWIVFQSRSNKHFKSCLNSINPICFVYDFIFTLLKKMS